MSCEIDLSEITSTEMIRQISMDLTFVSTEKEFAGKRAEPTIVRMWEKVYPNSLRLPFRFACNRFGRWFNEELGTQVSANITFNGQLRDYQIDVFEEMMGILHDKCSVTLSTFPGFGKTILATAAASKLKYRTAVIVNSLILLDQWKNSFEKTTNSRVQIVDRNFKGKEGDFDFDVFIIMNRQVSKMEPIRDTIGFLIFDEAHLLCTPVSQSAWLYFRPIYILVETATPFRSNNMHKMQISVSGTDMIVRKRKDKFKVILWPTDMSFSIRKNEDYISAMKRFQKDPKRLKIISDIIVELVRLEKKVLALGWKTSSIEDLKATLMENGIARTETLYGGAKKYIDGDVLIGTVGKIGTGFDQENATLEFDGKKFNAEILYDYIRDEGNLIQVTGRVLRSSSPVVIQIFDKYRNFTQAWMENLRLYQELDCQIIDLRDPKYAGLSLSDLLNL